MEKNYEDFEEFIADLIDGEQEDGTDLTIEDAAREMEESFKNQKEDFWEYLLAYMKKHGGIKQSELKESQESAAAPPSEPEEGGGGEEGEEPPTEPTPSPPANDQSSLFGFINQKADLDNLNGQITDFWQQLVDKCYRENLDKDSDTGKTENDKNYYWNESLSKAIVYFLLHFDLKTIREQEKKDGTALGISEENLEAFVNGTYDLSEIENLVFKEGIEVGKDGITHFHISDIINADAGLDFAGAPWVRPQYNVDGEVYKNVRGVDRIESVLNSSKELQFTVSQEKDPHWLRLIMPEYLRNVEVEDLNRNFWVIGQTIAALSAFLFGDDAPIPKLLKDMLNEIAQLWQNIMYLWATAALMLQNERYTDVHVEVVVLPNNDEQNYVKFDNFEGTIPTKNGQNEEIDWEEIKKRVDYIIKQYSTCNLVIIPCIRNNNYKHNYYSEEIYPGMLLYDRNLDKKRVVKFKNANQTHIKISVEDYKDCVYAIREEEDQYKYYYPYSKTITAKKKERFYGLLRVNPFIMVDYTINDNQFIFFNLSFTVYDRAYEVLKMSQEKSKWIDKEKPEKTNEKLSINDDGTVGIYELAGTSETEDKNRKFSCNDETETEININFQVKRNKSTIATDLNEEYFMDIYAGFYQGELVSQWNEIMATKYTIDIQALPVIPVHYYNKESIKNNDVYQAVIKNINKKNSSNAEQRFDSFMSAFGALAALQYIYDLEIGYYKKNEDESSEDGSEKTEPNYQHGAMKRYIGETVFKLDREVSEEDVNNGINKWIDTFDFDGYLDVFVDSKTGQAKVKTEDIEEAYTTKYDKKLETTDRFYLSCLFFYLLDMYDIHSLPANDGYKNKSYVEGAKVKISEYDKKALELFGQKYIKRINGDSIINGRFVLLETARSQQPYRGFGFQREALIIVDEKQKVVNETVNGKEDKNTSKYYANSFLLFGQSPLGDQRYTGMMAYPNEELTNKIYPNHYEYYRGEAYGASELYEQGLKYDENTGQFRIEGGQNVNTVQQDLILVSNGTDDNTELNENNWCAVTIKAQYIQNAKLYWDSINQDRTYADAYLLGGKKAPIVTQSVVININENYDNNVVQKEQKVLLEEYTKKEEEAEEQKNENIPKEWIGAVNDQNYFVNTPVAVQNTVSVFTHDGNYAQRIYVRQCKKDQPDYLKWKKIFEIKSDGTTTNGEDAVTVVAEASDVDQLRKSYKLIGNDLPNYNWEKYKSNGQYIPGVSNGDEEENENHFPKDDKESNDSSHETFTDPDNLLKTPFEDEGDDE